MSELPKNLYRAEQVRELDRIAIEEIGIPGMKLMERAGSAAFNAIISHYPRAKRIAVVCGTGNNGGDGFVIARMADAAGYTMVKKNWFNGLPMPAIAVRRGRNHMLRAGTIVLAIRIA